MSFDIENQGLKPPSLGQEKLKEYLQEGERFITNTWRNEKDRQKKYLIY